MAAAASPGKCHGTLEVGIDYLDANRAQGLASFGLSAAAAAVPSDAATVNEYNAYINYINGHGGLGGCTIKPIYLAYSGETGNVTTTQAVCLAFTKDNHVFVALTFWGPSTCIAAAKVPELAAPGSLGPLSKESPEYYLDPESTPVNPAPPYSPILKALFKDGFFVKGAKIGYMYGQSTISPDPSVVALNSQIKPGLKAVGLKLTAVESSRAVTASGGLTLQAQDCSRAAVKFRAAGVTEMLAASSGVIVTCAKAWAAQSFAPRTAMLLGEGAYQGTGAVAPQIPYLASTLAGSGNLWIGSQSVWDLGGGLVGTFSDWPASNRAKEQRCATIAGPNLASSAEGPDVTVCETLLWLQAAMNKAPSATPAGLEKGIEALGSYTGFADLWGPAQFDSPQNPTLGIHTIEIMTWDPSKHQYEAAGPPVSV